MLNKGDLCKVKLTGIANLPQIVKENNEIMYLGEFTQNSQVVAICSSIHVNELLFIQKELLLKNKNQLDDIGKMVRIQMDMLTTLKEISFQLKSMANDVAHVHGEDSEEDEFFTVKKDDDSNLH